MGQLPFPHDLLQAQIAWHRAYAALADAPAGPHTTAQRRRLLRLSVRVFWHPYWSDPPSPARREELRRQARALEPDAGA
ncbi:hypothetical protein [Actinacidiphila sp. ITFR-21]|uniref:hypothetical protein n=1 Tax=Actinacidiphila sp. ITFR-21 TaxID=3075199 RepID=UPI00288AB738|nr:hypothetical protein [Streptomyces sp. ITFR-21]WNI20098.1 hypothetical protein RLT57_31660 [Streptomyces sp. ITFR-21]